MGVRAQALVLSVIAGVMPEKSRPTLIDAVQRGLRAVRICAQLLLLFVAAWGEHGGFRRRRRAVGRCIWEWGHSVWQPQCAGVVAACMCG